MQARVVVIEVGKAGVGRRRASDLRQENRLGPRPARHDFIFRQVPADDRRQCCRIGGDIELACRDQRAVEVEQNSANWTRH